MPSGSVVSDIQSIASGAYLDVQPDAGDEWVITNIFHDSDIELIFYDGVNSITFDSEDGSGLYAKFSIHVTNSVYLRIKNTDTTPKLIGYDGLITTEA